MLNIITYINFTVMKEVIKILFNVCVLNGARIFDIN